MNLTIEVCLHVRVFCPEPNFADRELNWLDLHFKGLKRNGNCQVISAASVLFGCQRRLTLYSCAARSI